MVKEFLRENDIEYVERDIYQDDVAYNEFRAHGFRDIPSFIGDDEKFSGFDKEKLLEYQ